MRWRIFVNLCWIAVSGFLILPLSSAAQEKLRVGLSSVSATNGSVWVAEEKGLFKKYGVAYFKKNKRESPEILRKKLRIQSDQERDVRYLDLSYNILATSNYNDVPYPSLKGIETVLEFISADDPKARGADPKSFADDSLVREIDASGLIKKFYEK